MSALWSSKMATVTACPALAARISGVQPTVGGEGKSITACYGSALLDMLQ